MELTMEPLEEQISERLTHEIYRLVQETLINAARHAHASAVQVQLSMRDNQVHIVVADNGGGYPFRGRYDLAALTGRKLGPVSLQERIVSLGGGLTIDSTESGSRLEITLPLKHDWSPWDARASDSASGRNAMGTGVEHCRSL